MVIENFFNYMKLLPTYFSGRTV